VLLSLGLTALVSLSVACQGDGCPVYPAPLSTPATLILITPDGDELCDAEVESPRRLIYPVDDCRYHWPAWELEDAGPRTLTVHTDDADYRGEVALPTDSFDECGQPSAGTIEVELELDD
jgi:hypothetical protein